MMHIRPGRLLLAFMIVGTALLASCSQTPSSPLTSETATSASTKDSLAPAPTKQLAASPTPIRPQGSLIVLTEMGAGHLDPQTATGLTYSILSSSMFDTLLHQNDDEEWVGWLAERWELAKDGMSQTFYIRKGVKFHDGTDLTGADVKFSIERMLKPAATTQDAPFWRATVDRVELKDDYTVVIHMKTPQYMQIDGLQSNMGAVLPKKLFEEKGEDNFWRNPVGSGPWRFVKFQAGDRLEVEAVESHWREVPKFKKLTLVNLTEESTKVAMLKTGEADMAIVSTESVPGLKSAGVRIISFPGGTNLFVLPFWDLERPELSPLSDLRVRKALQWVIDGREMADKLFSGYGRTVSMPRHSETAFFRNAENRKPYPYDPEGAKKLLVEAGYPNGFNTKFWDTGGGGPVTLGNQAIAGYWQKIGIKAEIESLVHGTWLTKMRGRPRGQTSPEIYNTLWGYRTGGGSGWGSMAAYHSTDGIFLNIKIPRLDELINLVPQTKDLDERKRLGEEAAGLSRDAYHVLSPVSVDTTLAVSAKVGEVTRKITSAIPGHQYEGITHAK